jgi:hypothetical protein
MDNMLNIQDLMLRLTDARANAKEALNAESAAKEGVKQALSKDLHSYARPGCSGVGIIASAIEIGSWICDQSPAGVCVYDDYMDPAHDDCLYCNHPEERK